MIKTVNRLLPAKHFAIFVPADDESVDDEYAVHNENGDTGVALQLDAFGPCVSYWDEEDESGFHWSPRSWEQTAGIKSDIKAALAKATA